MVCLSQISFFNHANWTCWNQRSGFVNSLLLLEMNYCHMCLPKDLFVSAYLWKYHAEGRISAAKMAIKPPKQNNSLSCLSSSTQSVPPFSPFLTGSTAFISYSNQNIPVTFYLLDFFSPIMVFLLVFPYSFYLFIDCYTYTYIDTNFQSLSLI